LAALLDLVFCAETGHFAHGFALDPFSISGLSGPETFVAVFKGFAGPFSGGPSTRRGKKKVGLCLDTVALRKALLDGMGIAAWFGLGGA
jgi:hypothetical protein